MAIRRILLPTDFSELAQAAAVVARELAESHGATLYALHVVKPVIASIATSTLDTSAVILAPDESESRRELDAFAREHLSGCGVSVQTVLHSAEPVDAITQYARKKNVDLIVIGTHARGILRRLVHGSVSKSVMERSGCPVLMVPQQALTREEEATECSH